MGPQLEEPTALFQPISGDGIVAGYVRTETGVPGDKNMRAAVFQASRSPMVLTEVAALDGVRAVDINEQGQVLVQANLRSSGARSILWNLGDNTWAYVGDSSANVMPIALTNEGVVLGWALDAFVAVICKPNGAWEHLGTSGRWSPVDINDAGDVVGSVRRGRTGSSMVERCHGRGVFVALRLSDTTQDLKPSIILAMWSEPLKRIMAATPSFGTAIDQPPGPGPDRQSGKSCS